MDQQNKALQSPDGNFSEVVVVTMFHSLNESLMLRFIRNYGSSFYIGIDPDREIIKKLPAYNSRSRKRTKKRIV